MNPKKQILKYIQKAYTESTPPGDVEKRNPSGNQDSSKEIFQELFEGMSSGTARIVIEREMKRSFDEDFNIEQVKNQGRYYLARIVRHDGTTLQRLLVDKQTGAVHMVGKGS